MPPAAPGPGPLACRMSQPQGLARRGPVVEDRGGVEQVDVIWHDHSVSEVGHGELGVAAGPSGPPVWAATRWPSQFGFTASPTATISRLPVTRNVRAGPGSSRGRRPTGSACRRTRRRSRGSDLHLFRSGTDRQLSKLKHVGGPKSRTSMARTRQALLRHPSPDVAGLEAGVIRIDVEAHDPAGRIRMISGARWPSRSWVPTAVSASPRISRKCAPPWSERLPRPPRRPREVGSDIAVLALLAMFHPVISIVPGSVIAEPERLDLGRPSGRRWPGGRVRGGQGNAARRRLES